MSTINNLPNAGQNQLEAFDSIIQLLDIFSGITHVFVVVFQGRADGLGDLQDGDHAGCAAEPIHIFVDGK
jgi:hypothetical protein